MIPDPSLFVGWGGRGRLGGGGGGRLGGREGPFGEKGGAVWGEGGERFTKPVNISSLPWSPSMH